MLLNNIIKLFEKTLIAVKNYEKSFLNRFYEVYLNSILKIATSRLLFVFKKG